MGRWKTWIAFSQLHLGMFILICQKFIQINVSISYKKLFFFREREKLFFLVFLFLGTSFKKLKIASKECQTLSILWPAPHLCFISILQDILHQFYMLLSSSERCCCGGSCWRKTNCFFSSSLFTRYCPLFWGNMMHYVC